MWQSAQLAREQALESLQQDAENELRLSVESLVGRLSRHEYLPRLLASREGVKRFLSDPDGLDPVPLNLLLDRFRAIAGVSDIYLLDRHTETLAASNWHRPDIFIGQNRAQRTAAAPTIWSKPTGASPTRLTSDGMPKNGFARPATS